MAMLHPDEFSVGALKDANAVSLLLPRRKYDHTALVVPIDDMLMAVCLDVDRSSEFRSFECSSNDAWTGLLIPGVSVEVDAASLFDPASDDYPFGTVVRHGKAISIVARPTNGLGGYQMIAVQRDLHGASTALSAGFYKWTIGLGTGRDRRILYSTDRHPKGNDHA